MLRLAIPTNTIELETPAAGGVNIEPTAMRPAGVLGFRKASMSALAMRLNQVWRNLTAPTAQSRQLGRLVFDEATTRVASKIKRKTPVPLVGLPSPENEGP